MREQLVQYVNLLFAGAPDSDDIRQEILQNTLDRYDDLISQGKTPEAAYRLAISGIGDISEILEQNAANPGIQPVVQPVREEPSPSDDVADEDSTSKRKLRKTIGGIVGPIGLVLYFLISFTTHAWYITWLIFPLIGAVSGLINAIFDLREACKK